MPEQLERELRELGTHVAYPPEPVLVPAVLARLEEPRRPFFARRRVLVLALATLVVALAAAFAVPPARTAILRFFHIGGETIERVEKLPPAGRRSPIDGLRGPMSLERAAKLAGFEILLPSGTTAEGRRFYAGDGIVATYLTSEAGKRVLLTEARGDIRMMKKVAGPETRIEPLTVNDHDGLWIRGAPHVVFYFDSTARGHERRVRLAGNVLVWALGDVTLRLEGRLSRVQALDIAENIG